MRYPKSFLVLMFVLLSVLAFVSPAAHAEGSKPVAGDVAPPVNEGQPPLLDEVVTELVGSNVLYPSGCLQRASVFWSANCWLGTNGSLYDNQGRTTRAVQIITNCTNYYWVPRVVEDGIYGPQTAEAVSAFQYWHGLPSTGVVDSDTWNAIQSELVADVVVGRYHYHYVRGCPSRGNLFMFETNPYVGGVWWMYQGNLARYVGLDVNN